MYQEAKSILENIGISARDDIQSWVAEKAENLKGDDTKLKGQHDISEFLGLYCNAKIHNPTYKNKAVPKNTKTVGEFFQFLEGKGIDTKNLDSAILELDNEFKTRMLLICDPVVEIVGDIHGNYASLLKRLKNWDGKKTLLFMGDYGDNNRDLNFPDDSVAVNLHLYALKLLYPKKIHLLRGNHETKTMVNEYGKRWTPDIGYKALNWFIKIWQETMALTACVSPEGQGRFHVYVKHGQPRYHNDDSFAKLHGINIDPKMMIVSMILLALVFRTLS